MSLIFKGHRVDFVKMINRFLFFFYVWMVILIEKMDIRREGLWIKIRSVLYIWRYFFFISSKFSLSRKSLEKNYFIDL